MWQYVKSKNELNVVWEGLMNFDNIFEDCKNDHVKRKRE